MSNVKVKTREYPDHEMDCVFTGTMKEGKNGPAVNNQLVILLSDASKSLFNGMKYEQVISFSLNNGSFEDYYYLARDDRGFIFQSNP